MSLRSKWDAWGQRFIDWYCAAFNYDLPQWIIQRRMVTNIQSVMEKQRAVYESLTKPLLQQLAELHGLSIRDFAAIFGISKGHAEGILKHRVFPSLELAVRIARYFEVNVDELFAWRVDDTGERRSLLIELLGVKTPIRLNKHHDDTSLSLAVRVSNAMQVKGGIDRLSRKLRR